VTNKCFVLDDYRDVLLAEERQLIEARDISRSALDVECDAIFSRRCVVGLAVEPDRELRSEWHAWKLRRL
jgi:hypothetical protein